MADEPPLRISVALLGLGNVGKSFLRYVARLDEGRRIRVQIGAVADSSGGMVLESPEQLELLLAHKESGGSIRQFSPLQALDPGPFIANLPHVGISALLESLPTNLIDGEPALSTLTATLAQGTNVVTVDKGPLVHGFETLARTAASSGARLAFTGTTGVPQPEGLSGDRVLEIRGVLNGTTNYILTEMQERSLPFDLALSRAQADGIAEPNPAQDTEGWDTACKILILAKALMGADTRLAEVSRVGISRETEKLIQEARATGQVVRLIGRARIWKGRVRVSVAPKLISQDSPLFHVAGTSKAAIFRTESGGEVLSRGYSGRDAIARTMLDDLKKVTAI